MKNNFQKTFLIFSIILFLFLSVVFVFFIKKINDNNKKAEADAILWQIEADRRNEIIALDQSLKKISDNQALLNTHFASSSDIVPFLDTIERLGESAGAKAAIDSVDSGSDKTKLVVGLTASGSFESVYKFLTLLENSPYELNFLHMDMHNLTIPAVPGKISKNLEWEGVFKIQLLSFTP